MATPNSTVPTQAGGIAPLADLASLLGGTRTQTSSSANINPLLGLLTTIQSRDPNAQLAAVFQQAAGQIPGMQARLSNAIGARPGTNAPVAAQLQKLLQQTTLAGQQQIANQQLQSDATQANIGSAIAQATRGTNVQSGTNLGRATQVMGLLTAADKAMNSELGRRAIDKGSELLGSLGQYFGDGGGVSDAAGAMSLIPGGYDQIASGISDFASFIGDAASYDWDSMLTGFAEGGEVDTREIRSGGGRRGSGPTYEVAAPQRMSVGVGVSPSAAAAGDTAVGPTSQASSLAELGQAIADVAAQAAPVAAAALSANPIGLAVHGLNSVLGMPVTSQTANLGVNAATGQLSPIGAILGLLGMLADALADANGPLGQSSNSNDGGFGSPSAVSVAGEAGPMSMATQADPSSIGGMLGFSPASANIGSAIGAAISAANAEAAQEDAEGLGLGAATGDAGIGGNATGVGESAGVGAGEGGGDAGGMDGAIGDYASGGHVRGPGTGKSDSIIARLSDGEYVIPADVVRHVGVNFFDSLKDQFSSSK
jgi:hypothetical protein